MFVFNAIKDKQYPTILEAKEAFKKADDPNPQTRDVRPLMAVLMKMITANPRLRGHMTTRKTAVTAFSWDLVPYDTKDIEKTAQVKARCKHLINTILKQQAQAPAFGAMMLDINWKTGGTNGTTPFILKRYKPVELEQINDSRIRIIADTQDLAKGDEIDIQDKNQSKILDVDESFDRGGILRSLVYYEILRNDMVQEWSNFNTKLKGIAQAIFRDGATEEEKSAAESSLKQVVKHNYTLTSDAVEFKFIEMVNASSGANFSQIIEMFEKGGSIALLGQANTAELPNSGGSRAAMQVLQLIRADIHYNDIVRCEDIVNDQVLLYDFQVNGNLNAYEVPWYFKINIPEEVDLQARAAVIESILASNIPLQSSEVYSMLGFTKPEGVPDIFTGLVNQLNMAGAGQNQPEETAGV